MVYGINLNAREAASWGESAEKIPTPHLSRWPLSTQKEPERAPSGTPADGAEGLPHSGLFYCHFWPCFNIDYAPENDEIIASKIIAPHVLQRYNFAAGYSLVELKLGKKFENKLEKKKKKTNIKVMTINKKNLKENDFNSQNDFNGFRFPHLKNHVKN